MMTQALLETQSKELLRRYGIETTSPILVQCIDEASKALDEFAGPVALKIASVDIPHKALVGGVRLGVTRDSLSQAFDEVLTAGRKVSGARIAGVLMERMIPGDLELIVGALWHRVFGPVVMFGMGGTSVELRGNVSFALAPIEERAARELIEGFEPVRHLSEGAKKALVGVLLSVAGERGLLLKERLEEVDINPLIVFGEDVVAVDANVVPGAGEKELPPFLSGNVEDLSELRSQLAAAFEPSGVVVVGASTKPDKLGFSVLRNLVDYGFRGPLFAVHPTANNIYGCAAFKSIQEIPKEVDRAIVIVPADEVATSLRDCSKIGVRVAQVFSAGFSESSDGGKALEAAIKEAVAETGIRVIGPNTIGTFSSTGMLTLTAPRYSPRGKGSIAFVSQSGTYALDVICRSNVLGLPLEISVSCGNCADLKPVDYLNYFKDRPDIKVIAMYLESMDGAGEFLRSVANIQKPVVLLKGGRTAAGFRAASSHTGALASDFALWRDAAKRAGTILVDDIEQLLDVLLALSAFDVRCFGDGLALFTSGGGISVGAADAAEAVGLRMAGLSAVTMERLARYGAPGTSVRNPVDIPVWGLKSSGEFIFHDMIDTLAGDPGVDSVIACIEMGSVFSFTTDEAAGIEQIELITESLTKKASTKPVSAVFRTTGDRTQDDYVRNVRKRLLAKGIAVFPTMERAVRAHAKIASGCRYAN